MYRVIAYRLFLLTVCAFWLGGLTFYAAVVIPTANKVLGSHLRVGFVTQQVTGWINVSATVALLVLLVPLLAGRASTQRGLWLVLLGTWLMMAGSQAGLFVLHSVLDGLLDPARRQILDEDRFYGLHRAYLITTMMQQAAGLVHITGVLTAWRFSDRKAPAWVGSDQNGLNRAGCGVASHPRSE